MTPTSRTLKLLREQGYSDVQVVERWNHFAKIRQDLFKFIDIVGLSPENTIDAIQATDYTNISHRRTKILALPSFLNWKRCGGRVLLIGWKKNARGRWEPKIEWM